MCCPSACKNNGSNYNKKAPIDTRFFFSACSFAFLATVSCAVLLAGFRYAAHLPVGGPAWLTGLSAPRRGGKGDRQTVRQRGGKGGRERGGTERERDRDKDKETESKRECVCVTSLSHTPSHTHAHRRSASCCCAQPAAAPCWKAMHCVPPAVRAAALLHCLWAPHVLLVCSFRIPGQCV